MTSLEGGLMLFVISNIDVFLTNYLPYIYVNITLQKTKEVVLMSNAHYYWGCGEKVDDNVMSCGTVCVGMAF